MAQHFIQLFPKPGRNLFGTYLEGSRGADDGAEGDEDGGGGEVGGEHAAHQVQVDYAPGAQFNRKKVGLSFGLKTHLSFGLRFPTLRKC